MAKTQGHDWRLYVGSSAPGTDFDSGDAVWDLVGFSTDTNLNPTKELIESADKDSAYESTYVAARRDATVSETVFSEATHSATDEGQELLWTSYNSDDTSIYFLVSDGVTGNEAFQGQAYVEDLDKSMSDQEMTELDVSLQVTGGVDRGSHV